MLPAKKCHTKTTFFQDVLYSINALQFKQRRGVNICDLVEYMQKNYKLTGDVESQVQNALLIAQDSHFVLEKNSKYSLLSPAARLHTVSPMCLKNERERIEEIFGTIKKRPKKTRCPSMNRSSSREGSRTRSSLKRSRSNSQIAPVCSSSLTRSSTPKSCCPCRRSSDPDESFLNKFWPSLLSSKKEENKLTNTLCSCTSKNSNNNKSVSFKKSTRKDCRLNCTRSMEKLKNLILNDKKKCNNRSSGSCRDPCK